METEEVQVRDIPEVSTPTTEVLSLADLMEEPVPSTEGWQTECDLSERGLHLLRSGTWADVQFAVGDSGEILQAHRLILASGSPVFAAMMYGPLAETSSPIKVPDVTPQAFDLLLQFIYTDKTEKPLTIEEVPEITYVSKKYLVPRLIKYCVQGFTETMTAGTAVKCFEYANVVECESLIEECNKMFTSETMQVLNSESFLQASVETVKHIFSLDRLLIPSEVDLLTAAERYVKAQVLDITENGQVESGMKEVVLPLLQQIRFLGMDYENLAKLHERLRKFLSEQEILALFLNKSVENVTPMPEGFSQNRNIRHLTLPILLVPIPGPIRPGRVITIHGHVQQGAERFDVNLQDNDVRCTYEEFPMETTILFQIGIRFYEDVVVRNTFRRKWENEEREGGFPLRRGEPFHMTITIEFDRFVVRFNDEFFCDYKHRVPIEQLSHFGMNGRVEDARIDGITFY